MNYLKTIINKVKLINITKTSKFLTTFSFIRNLLLKKILIELIEVYFFIHLLKDNMRVYFR